MVHQVFYIFQQEGVRPTMRDYAGDFEEQRTLGFTREAVWTTQRIFLRNACNRKRLTGKTSKKHIMIGNSVARHCANVTGNFVFIVWKVGFVGLLTVAIPFACKNAFAAD
jgi:hypothetical protein